MATGASAVSVAMALALLGFLLALAPAAEPPLRAANVARAISVTVRAAGIYGAGVLVDPAHGWVLTASHVLEGVDGPVWVVLPDGARVPAERGEADADLDLEVLSIPRRPGAPPALGSIATLPPGAQLVAVGCRRGQPFTLGVGRATLVGRPVMGSLYLETDLPLDEGDSGGPVVDASGRLVGLVGYLLRGAERINFALPVDYAVERFPWLFPEIQGREGYLVGFSEWRERRWLAAAASPALPLAPARKIAAH